MPFSRKRRALSDLTRPAYKLQRRACILCSSGEDNEEFFGKFYQHPRLYAHFNCMIFSSGLNQASDADDEIEEHVGGFEPDAVVKEARRAGHLRCYHCHLRGASVGCVTQGCRRGFHFPCAVKANATLQHYSNFSTYCSVHKPKQNLKPWLAESYAKTTQPQCAICLEDFPVNTSTPEDGSEPVHSLEIDGVIHGECCVSSWLHMDCAKAYAASAGVYFCKCPLCNDKDIFQGTLQRLGVYLPDKDANWELEPNAFEDLYSRSVRCTAKPCRCPRGDLYDSDQGIWDVLLCHYCGSSAVHRGCLPQLEGNKEDVPKSKRRISWRAQYVCLDCRPVVDK